jgi:hypothetical protein
MSRYESRIYLFALLAATGLALTGCVPTVVPGGGASSEAEAGVGEGTSGGDTEAVDSGPECLVGDWQISQEQMQSFYDTLAANSGVDGFEVEGGTGLSFTGTTYAYTPDFALSMSASGMPVTAAISGTIAGDYTADDEKVTTSHETNDTTLAVSVGGTPFDGGDLFSDLLASSPINSAPYTCTADGPLIEFDAGSSRVPIQLTSR